LSLGRVTSEHAREKLEVYIATLVHLAEENAKKEGRKSILPRDIDEAYIALGGTLIDSIRRTLQK